MAELPGHAADAVVEPPSQDETGSHARADEDQGRLVDTPRRPEGTLAPGRRGQVVHDPHRQPELRSQQVSERDVAPAQVGGIDHHPGGPQALAGHAHAGPAEGARRHATLTDDGEQADLAGRARVSAAAEFDAEARDRNDAHTIAVFLAEERHCALLDALHFSRHRIVVKDVCVDDLLDLGDLGRRDRREVREVKTQTVGRDEGARLLHVRAEHLTKGRVQKVSGRMVRHDGLAAWRLT